MGVCLWPSKPLSPGLVPCGPVGINTCFTRFLQSIHKDLEAKIARFHQREDAILYPSCFDANAGLFEVCGGHGWELVKPARLWKVWVAAVRTWQDASVMARGSSAHFLWRSGWTK